MMIVLPANHVRHSSKKRAASAHRLQYRISRPMTIQRGQRMVSMGSRDAIEWLLVRCSGAAGRNTMVKRGMPTRG